MRVRQRYARTDVGDQRAFTADITVLEFCWAVYRVRLSNLAPSLVIKRKKKSWLGDLEKRSGD